MALTMYVDLISGNDGTTKTISGATKANPCVITCTGHGFSNGDTVTIWGIAGMTQLNARQFTIANQATNSFELQGENSTGYTTYTSGGSANVKGTIANPMLLVNTANAVTGLTDIKVLKTTAYTSVGSCTFGWTANSVTITTTSDQTTNFPTGSYIGKTTAAGNGAEETFWRVTSSAWGGASGSITLEQKYAGATGTEASAYKLVPITTGASNATAMTLTAGVNISGGWNSTFTTQDGETWFKVNGVRQTYHGLVLGTGGACSKMNCVESQQAMLCAAAGAFTNCTAHGYSIGIASSGGAISYCCASGQPAGTSGSFYLYSNAATSLINSTAIGGYAVAQLAAGQVLSNLKIYSAVYGVYGASGNGNPISNSTFKYCTTGYYNIQSGVKVDTCVFDTCTTGISGATAIAAGDYFKDCTFQYCTLGVNVYLTHADVFDNCTFTSNGIDVNMDNYSGDCRFYNCTSTTPTNYHVSRVANAGLTTFYNCSIDGASIAKAYQVTASPYLVEQYKFIGSFAKNGTVYGNNTVVQDSTNHRTTAPCLAISTVSSSTTSNLDIKVFSAYVNASATRTYAFYIKASNNSWAGTLTVKWKLNGATIKTEGVAITSLTTSWAAKSYTCDTSLITTDGELSIEFTSNSNAYSVYVDDFVVT